MYQISSEWPKFYGTYDEKYFGIISSTGVIDWKNNCTYWGVYFVSGRACV